MWTTPSQTASSDHPTAKRAYAWSYERDDGRRRFFAVSHTGPIASPHDAVRAAIVVEVSR